jgi:hypothetical protein
VYEGRGEGGGGDEYEGGVVLTWENKKGVWAIVYGGIIWALAGFVALRYVAN